MPQADAAPEIMGTAELCPGMQGQCYTVIDSSGEISSFNVTIIGVINDGQDDPDAILVRASGPVIEETGGILHGMSGSPVYVDGKLIGALSRAFEDTDPYVFFLTPIEKMLPIWDLPDNKNKTQIAQVDFKKIAQDKAKAEEEAKKKAEAQEGDKKAAEDKAENTVATEADLSPKQDDSQLEAAAESASVAIDEKTEAASDDAVIGEKDKEEAASLPAEEIAAAEKAVAEGRTETKADMYAAGFGEAGFSYLRRQLSAMGIDTADFSGLAGNSAGNTDYNACLYPGSPVGVALVYGDFIVGATGTVTAVDGNRILAFGHALWQRGNVNYFLTDASIVGVLPSFASKGMTLSNAGNIIGRVSQDRSSGVSGELGVFPSVVPVKVHVNAKSQAQAHDYKVFIAYDEALLPYLSASIAYASLTKTADNLGSGTAKVKFVIGTNVAPEKKFERSNMYYNTADVGQIAFNELAQAMELICTNADKESDVFGVTVDITLDNDRKTASLISAVPDKTEVKPGDTVNFKTTIKPYRSKKIVLQVPYKVPRSQKEGALHLDIRGGGLIPASQLLLMQQAAAGVDFSAEEDKTQTTEDKLKAFASASRNNDIVISPGTSPLLMTEAEQKEAVRKAAAQAEEQEQPASKLSKKDADSPESRFSTDYIIDNVIHTNLQIVKK